MALAPSAHAQAAAQSPASAAKPAASATQPPASAAQPPASAATPPPSATEPAPAALPPEYDDAARARFAANMKDARALMAQKRFEEAIAKLDAISRERPREPQARFLKGVALTDLGRLDEAIKVFEALTGDFPELPEPHNNLAALYARQGKLDLARHELELALTADPNYGVAAANLGDVYLKLAISQYQRATPLLRQDKDLPVKLKLARDALAAKAPAAPAETASGASPAAPGDAVKGNSANPAPSDSASGTPVPGAASNLPTPPVVVDTAAPKEKQK